MRSSHVAGTDTVKDAKQELYEQFAAFNENIRDIYSDFDQFFWMRVLALSAINYLLHLTR